MKRMMLATILLSLLGAGLLLGTAAPHGQADEKKPAPAGKPDRADLSRFMRAKLACSEQILDGVVTEDFSKIENGTLRLQLISAAQEWKVRDDQLFVDRSEEFRLILSRLKSHTQKKNLEGAALSYLELTMNCIQCHKELRLPPAVEKSSSR